MGQTIGQLFKGELTNPAVMSPGGGIQYFPNDAAAGIGMAQQAASQAQPATASLSDSGVTFNQPQVQSPSMSKPSFLRAASSTGGNISNPALTKGGKLLAILKGGAMGAGAAAGARTFGEGMQTAQAMPFIQAQRQQGLQKGQLENQMLGAQVQMLPWKMAGMQANLAKTQAETKRNVSQAALDEANALKANFMEVGGIPYQIQPGQAGQPPQLIPIQSGATIPASEEVAKVLNVPAGSQVPIQRAMQAADLLTKGITNYTTAEGVFERNRITGTNTRLGSPVAMVIKPTIEEADLSILAKSLVDPRNLTALKDVTSLRGDQRTRVFAEAKRLDPTFDPGVINQRIRFLQNYEDPKGRAALNRQSINNIIQHAGDLSDLNQLYRRQNVRVLNTPINALASQFGNTVYTQFQTTLGVLKDELALYFAGGYAPQQEQIKMWNNILADNATPGQTEAFAKEVIHLGLRRASTFNSQFKTMMGYDDPNMLIPEAVEAGQKLGMDKEMSKFGTGGMIGGSGTGPQTGQPKATHRFNPQTGAIEPIH